MDKRDMDPDRMNNRQERGKNVLKSIHPSNQSPHLPGQYQRKKGGDQMTMGETPPLQVSDEDGARVDRLAAAAAAAAARSRRARRSDSHSHIPSFFEGFTLQGIRVDTITPGHILCSFTVPTRLTTKAADHLHLAPGAVVSLVDEIGSAASIAHGNHLKVSVDMSVSFVDLAAAAAPGDTLRITARALGSKGSYCGTHVLIANAATGQVVAEGRHSLFGNMNKIRSNI